MPLRTDRIVFNVMAHDIAATAAFYERLAGLRRLYTSDWYIVLTPTGELGYELGIIDGVHEFAPRQARGQAGGGYLTLVVEDVFAAHEEARAMEADIIAPPAITGYGQTRMLLRDPNGLVVDLSSPTDK